MKKTILLVFLFLIFGNSDIFAFTSEEIYDRGGKQNSYHPKSAYSTDGGYNYEDYMGKPQTEISGTNRNRSVRDRDPSSYHFEFEANLNPSVVEGRLAAFLPLNLNSIGAAVGILYEKENFTIGHGDFTIGNRHNADVIIFDIGFRALMGSAEKSDSFENGDVKALGFLGSVIYNIGAETLYQFPLNLELAGELMFAPKPLCFGDAEEATEVKVTLGLDVFGDGRGFIFIGGRYINLQLNKNSENWDASGGSVFGGFKIRF